MHRFAVRLYGCNFHSTTWSSSQRACDRRPGFLCNRTRPRANIDSLAKSSCVADCGPFEFIKPIVDPPCAKSTERPDNCADYRNPNRECVEPPISILQTLFRHFAGHATNWLHLTRHKISDCAAR